MLIKRGFEVSDYSNYLTWELDNFLSAQEDRKFILNFVWIAILSTTILCSYLSAFKSISTSSCIHFSAIFIALCRWNIPKASSLFLWLNINFKMHGWHNRIILHQIIKDFYSLPLKDEWSVCRIKILFLSTSLLEYLPPALIANTKTCAWCYHIFSNNLNANRHIDLHVVINKAIASVAGYYNHNVSSEL